MQIRQAFILLFSFLLFMTSCEKKSTFKYEFYSNVPNIIQRKFSNQYSEKLTTCRWGITGDQYWVYFDQNNTFKIGSYDKSANLIQMQPLVSLTGELENVMDIRLEKGKDFKIESCFWVIKTRFYLLQNQLPEFRRVPNSLFSSK